MVGKVPSQGKPLVFTQHRDVFSRFPSETSVVEVLRREKPGEVVAFRTSLGY